MYFNYLPWQLYVFLAIGSSILLLMYTKKIWKREPKSFNIGLLLVSVGAIIAGTIRFISEFQIFYQHQNMLKIATMACTTLGSILIMIGAYKKVENNKKKRGIMKILIGLFIVSIVLIAAIVLINLK